MSQTLRFTMSTVESIGGVSQTVTGTAEHTRSAGGLTPADVDHLIGVTKEVYGVNRTMVEARAGDPPDCDNASHCLTQEGEIKRLKAQITRLEANAAFWKRRVKEPEPEPEAAPDDWVQIGCINPCACSGACRKDIEEVRRRWWAVEALEAEVEQLKNQLLRSMVPLTPARDFTQSNLIEQLRAEVETLTERTRRDAEAFRAILTDRSPETTVGTDTTEDLSTRAVRKVEALDAECETHVRVTGELSKTLHHTRINRDAYAAIVRRIEEMKPNTTGAIGSDTTAYWWNKGYNKAVEEAQAIARNGRPASDDPARQTCVFCGTVTPHPVELHHSEIECSTVQAHNEGHAAGFTEGRAVGWREAREGIAVAIVAYADESYPTRTHIRDAIAVSRTAALNWRHEDES